MALKADTLAAALQATLRGIGSRTRVEYVGGGWFRVRRPNTLTDGKRMRADDLRQWVDDTVRAARDPLNPPVDLEGRTLGGWQAARAGRPREQSEAITGPSRGMWFQGYDAFLARKAEVERGAQ